MQTAPQIRPPKLTTISPLAIFAAVILAAAMAGAGAVLFFFDPAKNNFYPVCVFHQLTGLNCPGCGATRALYALLHGNFALALRDNALFIFVLVALALRGSWFAVKKILRRPAGKFVSPESLWFFLVVAIVFVVLRNLPAFAFLSP